MRLIEKKLSLEDNFKNESWNETKQVEPSRLCLKVLSRVPFIIASGIRVKIMLTFITVITRTTAAIVSIFSLNIISFCWG